MLNIMIVLDIILALIVLFFAYKGFRNGLLKELGSLIALIAGVFLAIRFSDFVAKLLQDQAGFSSEYLPVISFAVIFIAIIVVVLMFSKILDQFIKLIKLQWLNKIGGIVFGSLKTIIILGGLFFLLCQFNQRLDIVGPETFNKSILFNPFISVFEFIFPYAEHLYFENIKA
jgi:membrane protein required for colicin V production